MIVDTSGKKIGKRANNGAKFKDLSGMNGVVHGTRTCTGTEVTGVYGSARQFLVFECTCGAVSRYEHNRYLRGIGKCKQCRGTGVGSGEIRNDYASWVNRVLDGFRISAFETTTRPMFTVRCPRGHVFQRLAWDVVTTGRVRRCPACTGFKQRTADVADASDPYVPEVCDCTFFNGVLRRACRQHRGAA